MAADLPENYEKYMDAFQFVRLSTGMKAYTLKQNRAII
jgi:hypothetical protein